MLEAPAYRHATDEEQELLLSALEFYCRMVTQVDDEYLGIYRLYTTIGEGGLMLPDQEG